ncbi:MAG TPA: excalibur calcium-binding domain-containing protein [Natronosporangium sp.]
MGRRGEGWRERWAQQETERRTAAYEVELARWRERDAELRDQLATAAEAAPARDGDWSDWLQLAEGERVYWAADDAGLIVAPYVLRLRPPHHREFGRADEPAAGPPVDTGRVAITDRRIVYIGRMVRQWEFAKLIGMSHTVGGETWLLATTGRQVAGIAPAPADVAAFRLHLALALADQAGQREALVADLEQRVDEHARAEPAPPAPVTPDEAPPTAQPSGRGRRLTVAAAGGAVLVSLVAIGIALPDRDPPADAFPATPEPPPATVAPATTAPANPTEAAPAPEAREPVRLADPPEAAPPPPPPSPTESPSPSPSPTPSPTSSEDPVDPWFPNCAEANRNGYGPYFRDRDPEYWWYPDRNGDGVVCRPDR